MDVTYIDHMGSDLSVVNAARVSFGKKSEEFTEKDANLIRFLARGCTANDWSNMISHFYVGAVNDDDREYLEEIAQHIKNMPTHLTPFGHTAITLHIKAPIFVARQLGKHQVGMVWNEVSRRYVTDEPEFYVPDVWRKAAENVKQGSSDEPVKSYNTEAIGLWHDDALRYYELLLNDGVCPEIARMVLPQSMYTEWYWTGNLYGFANVYNLRSDSHTQHETQEVAKQIGEIIKPLYPVSWEALTNG